MANMGIMLESTALEAARSKTRRGKKMLGKTKIQESQTPDAMHEKQNGVLQ